MANDYIINPGSVYQTYTPATGKTTYGNAPAGFAAGANQSVQAPMVQTPTGTPAGASVYQGTGLGYAPMSELTSFGYDPNTGMGSQSLYAQNPTAYPNIQTYTPSSVNQGYQAGQLIANPADLSKYKEGDIARTTGNEIFRRDLAKEQKMLGEYVKSFGKPSSEQDWKQYHDFVYMGRLPKAGTPGSAGDINQMGGTGLGSATMGNGDVTDAMGLTAGMSTGLATQDKILADRMEQVKQIQAEMDKRNKPFLDKLLGSKSPEQAAEDAWERTGINPEEYYADQKARIAEIEALTIDYNNALASKEAQVAKTQDMMGSMNFINNQTAQINRNAAPLLNQKAANINAKAATLQALQGNFTSAQNFVNQAVDQATAQYKFNYDQYKVFYDYNKDAFDAIDSVYKTAFESAMNNAQFEYEMAVADKRAVGELMMNNPQAGITMTDTLMSAQEKIMRTGGSMEYKLQQKALNAPSGGGGSSSGLTSEEKALQSDLDKAFLELAEDKNAWGKWFNFLKARYQFSNDDIDMLLQKGSFFPVEEERRAYAGEDVFEGQQNKTGIFTKFKNWWKKVPY